VAIRQPVVVRGDDPDVEPRVDQRARPGEQERGAVIVGGSGEDVGDRQDPHA
jgi:hypothetical protein